MCMRAPRPFRLCADPAARMHSIAPLKGGHGGSGVTLMGFLFRAPCSLEAPTEVRLALGREWTCSD